MIFLGLDIEYLARRFGARALAKKMAVATARRVSFLTATLLMCAAVVVPFVRSTPATSGVLVVVNLAIDIWIAMYLTMAQEVSAEHVSIAGGLLGGSGSLPGALLIWLVGRVTRQTGNFVILMAGVAVAAVLASVAGWFMIRTPSNRSAWRTQPYLICVKIIA